MTELQNDRMTDRTKTICPPIFDLGGIKKSTVTVKNKELSALLERSGVSISQFGVYCTVFALSSWIEEIVFLYSKTCVPLPEDTMCQVVQSMCKRFLKLVYIRSYKGIALTQSKLKFTFIQGSFVYFLVEMIR